MQSLCYCRNPTFENVLSLALKRLRTREPRVSLETLDTRVSSHHFSHTFFHFAHHWCTHSAGRDAVEDVHYVLWPGGPNYLNYTLLPPIHHADLMNRGAGWSQTASQEKQNQSQAQCHPAWTSLLIPFIWLLPFSSQLEWTRAIAKQTDKSLEKLINTFR